MKAKHRRVPLTERHQCVAIQDGRCRPVRGGSFIKNDTSIECAEHSLVHLPVHIPSMHLQDCRTPSYCPAVDSIVHCVHLPDKLTTREKERLEAKKDTGTDLSRLNLKNCPAPPGDIGVEWHKHKEA